MLDFEKTKEQLIQCLKEAKKITDYKKDETITADIDYELDKLLKNRFNLAVVGQFKRGKSTFINAVLGEKVVPTAVVPLTSVVTVIKYGPTLKVTVNFLDGSEEEINVKELDKYATEKGNPGNEKKVKEIVVEYPSEFLKKGVILIDTPGVGSVYQHNTDTTYHFLPKLDAAIFLFTIDSPVSQNEYEFLKDVKEHAVRIFFVLNKIDYTEENDVKEALDFARGILKEKLGYEEIKIFPLSAKMALEAKETHDEDRLRLSGLPEFLSMLDEFITKEKGKALLLSSCNNALRFTSMLRFDIELEASAIKTPLEDLEKNIEVLRKKIEEIEDEKKDVVLIFEGESRELLAQFNAEYEKFKNSEYRKLEAALEEYFKSNAALPLKELIEKTREYITGKTLEAIDSWKEEELKRLAEASARITGRLGEKVEKIIMELKQLTANMFHIKFESFTRIENFKEAGYFYYNMEPEKNYLLPTPLSIAPFLPGFIARKMALNSLKNWLQQQFDRQCGRVRYDIAQRMEKTFKEYYNYLEGKIAETAGVIMESVREAVELKKSGEDRIKGRLKELEAFLERLNEIEGKIKELKDHLERVA
ncbi:small GTP-binding protein domain-containing protein [Caldanaerovirga acetigignens]|uniref:Small GTP-binding protein domain-containing protein n=1 Tax=Caldanaerovirga acetigignens TaxID=447595 RepID=A0A1M7HIA0_9FIRM|nr:dynamin family protein [Caldanaerovirga acetigignens]SHM28158.1 small GTP-binding protein domain-containing protein [Caldanaerovirga acetigignens]